MDTAGYAQVVDHREFATEQVFILDLRRPDGSTFVTSVSDRSEVRTTAKRLHAQETTVSHWRRDGERVHVPQEGSIFDWKLAERYAL